MVVVIEVLERRVAAKQHSTRERVAFRDGTLARLTDEFGDRIHVVWSEPAPGTSTVPTTVVGGLVVQSNGYLSLVAARRVVKHALAVEAGEEPYRADLDDLIEKADFVAEPLAEATGGDGAAVASVASGAEAAEAAEAADAKPPPAG